MTCSCHRGQPVSTPTRDGIKRLEMVRQRTDCREDSAAQGPFSASRAVRTLVCVARASPWTERTCIFVLSVLLTRSVITKSRQRGVHLEQSTIEVHAWRGKRVRSLSHVFSILESARASRGAREV